jgi:hypothetical protein
MASVQFVQLARQVDASVWLLLDCSHNCNPANRVSVNVRDVNDCRYNEVHSY